MHRNPIAFPPPRMSQTSNHRDQSLPAGCRIDEYTIERRLGGGGFSIVYLASDSQQRQVVIKEYIPRKLAERGPDGMAVRPRDADATESFSHGRRLFFHEASTLATLKHPNIVDVTNFFRANGTVYMVMAYERGINLQEYIRRHNGGLSETFLRTVFPALLDGLRLIHERGMLHLDIKPGNIYLRRGGNPLLLDFGAVHHMLRSRQYQPSQVVTPGFSPVEQLDPNGYVGPWTDIYALGATMRACIEGAAPPRATERRMGDAMKPAATAFRKRYSQPLLLAIDQAMEVDPLLRPQSVDAFLALLDADAPPADESEQTGSVLGRIANSLPWAKGS